MIEMLFIEEGTDADEEDTDWEHELPAVPRRGDWVSLPPRGLFEVVRVVWYPRAPRDFEISVYVRCKEPEARTAPDEAEFVMMDEDDDSWAPVDG